MPAKNRVKLESRFPAVKEAAHDAVRAARDLALNVGEGEAEKRLERIDDQRGYELPIDIEQEHTGFQSGRIFYSQWYGRFFEYGTVRIPAAPFMRPAHRKMRKTFLASMGEDFDGFVKRRASVRRTR
jgi:HK97 gp10 family phage protein